MKNKRPKNYYITPLVKLGEDYEHDQTYGPMNLELPKGVDKLFYSELGQAAWGTRGAWSYNARLPDQPEVIFVLSKTPQKGLDWIESLKEGSVTVREP